jgi:hypothetical protein
MSAHVSARVPVDASTGAAGKNDQQIGKGTEGIADTRADIPRPIVGVIEQYCPPHVRRGLPARRRTSPCHQLVSEQLIVAQRAIARPEDVGSEEHADQQDRVRCDRWTQYSDRPEMMENTTDHM